MVHVGALPGTPENARSLIQIASQAKKEAAMLRDAGVDAIMIENMHDRPYLRGTVGPEIVSSMTVLAKEVKEVAGDLPCGVQILAAANQEALAVAHAADFDFVRVEGFVFAHVADEGIIEGCAGDLLRYRKQIGAEHISIFTDIKKKHSSHAITSDIDIAECAKAAEFFLSDGIILTGTHTGGEANPAEIKAARNATGLPILIGSGVTAHNIATYSADSDAVIVGSDLKEKGDWRNPVDPGRTDAFLKALRN
jgi:membrane complex biogenesis BtpA family protein